MKIYGWAGLVAVTGMSFPVLKTSVRLRDFPKPKTECIPFRTCVWDLDEVKAWLTQQKKTASIRN